VHKSSQLSY